MGVLPGWKCTLCVLVTWEGQNREWELLELEFQVAVSSHVGDGERTQVL